MGKDTIGNRIKTIRKLLNLTQESFATALGIDRGHIANIENDSRQPSESLFRHICLKYCVSEAWLKTGEGDMLVSPENIYATHVAVLGQQTVINAFLNIMKECSTGWPLVQQLHRPALNDPNFKRIIDALYDLWNAGDENLKGWAVIQFDRAFPADVIQEAQKKQTETWRRQSANEVS